MRIPGFHRRADDDGPVYIDRRPGESIESYEQRLAAARARAHDADDAAERRAYEQGRRDQSRVERPRRHGGGFGLIGALLVVVAAVGALWVALALREGSFAGGGAVVDQKLAEVTQPARVATNEAVDRTGQALQNAGQAIERRGERIRETAR